MAKDYSNENWRHAEITEQLSPTVYSVKTDDQRQWKRHVDQLRPCNANIKVAEAEETSLTPAFSNVELQPNVLDKAILKSDALEKRLSTPDIIPNDSICKGMSVPQTPCVKSENTTIANSNDESHPLRRSSRIKKPRQILDL